MAASGVLPALDAAGGVLPALDAAGGVLPALDAAGTGVPLVAAAPGGLPLQAAGPVVLLLLVLVLAFPLVLYFLVRAEHDQRETMDREEAERVARRDRDDPE